MQQTPVPGPQPDPDPAPDFPVFRRKVFYLPGFDPFPPRRYRELYRKEGAAQAALSGYRLDLRAQPGDGGHGWQVTTEIGGLRARAEIEVLVWSDLVQAAMDKGLAGAWAQLFRTARSYAGSGALIRLLQLRKGPVLAALYPVAMLLGQAGLALLAGLLAGRGLAALLPGGTGIAAGWLAGLALAGLVLVAFRRLDRKLFAYYLLHDYAYSALEDGAYPPALSARLDAFAARIGEALRGDWNEVLVVGHSSGAHLAVSTLARVIRGGLPPRRPALALLTLGQAIPMVSFLPAAQALRGDLRYLSQRSEISWIDVTAPGDGCSFALCDPVAVSGAAGPGKRWPLIVSGAFTQTLKPQTWRRLRWRFFRLHFQYLCAFDNLPGQRWDYEFFRVTAGPWPVSALFAGRPRSKQIIDRVLTPHATMPE